jgi:uncharacterized protein YktA (UPF0223 family)
MSKRKFSELNDIIETAYVVADYSDSNRCYDGARERETIRRDENVGQLREQTHEPYRVGFSNNNSFRNDGGNIFLKKSQSNSQNSFSNTNVEKPELKKVVLNDDNFPSLGTNSAKINKSSVVETKLNFKKVVEKKVDIVDVSEQKITNAPYKKNNYSQYSIYQEIKEKSEKFAKLKMVNDVSSDDNADDGYY